MLLAAFAVAGGAQTVNPTLEASRAVRAKAEWRETFNREIFGRIPANTPNVTWRVDETVRENFGAVPVVTRKPPGHVDNSAYPAITIDIEVNIPAPESATGKHVPAIMALTFLRPFVLPDGRPLRSAPPGGTRWRRKTGLSSPMTAFTARATPSAWSLALFPGLRTALFQKLNCRSKLKIGAPRQCSVSWPHERPRP